ncbi:MAG: hypothetical protein IH995_02485 [Proteobacteria bacterium]|nr:hypothetical protein [Pseudomonadota bacterium]
MKYLIPLLLLVGCSQDFSGGFDRSWQKMEFTPHVYDTLEAVKAACKQITGQDYEACATWGAKGNHLYFKRPVKDLDFYDIGHELWHIIVGSYHK